MNRNLLLHFGVGWFLMLCGKMIKNWHSRFLNPFWYYLSEISFFFIKLNEKEYNKKAYLTSGNKEENIFACVQRNIGIIKMNFTERRRMDSSCEREINKSSIRKHPDHILLGRRSSQDNPELYAGIEVIRNPLVNNEQREIGSLSSPNILEQIIGPCSHPPYINIIIETNPAAFQKSAKRIEGTAITLVYAKISENEKTEKLGLLTVHPVYWREFRVRRNRTPQTPEQLHNPLQSMMYSHLMSVTLMFTSTHEGYLYHVPGHIRRQGKGVGVQKIATYPFTSPVKSIVLEPSLIHALTETGKYILQKFFLSAACFFCLLSWLFFCWLSCFFFIQFSPEPRKYRKKL